jgi:hypothetical protein
MTMRLTGTLVNDNGTWLIHAGHLPGSGSCSAARRCSSSESACLPSGYGSSSPASRSSSAPIPASSLSPATNNQPLCEPPADTPLDVPR